MLAALPGQALAESEVTPTISVQDNPTTLIDGVTNYYLRDPKLFSHHAPRPCGPSAAEAPQVTTYESVQRIPSRGGLTRYLYWEAQGCNSAMIQSNIVADDNYVYWTDPMA